MTITTPPDSRVSSLSVGYDVDGLEVSRSVQLGDHTVRQIRRRVGPTVSGDHFSTWWGSFLRGPRMQEDRGRTPLRATDLFSSVGGLSLGAADAASTLGYRLVPLLAADTDARAAHVYRKNFRPRQTLTESIKGLLDFRVAGSGPMARFAYPPTVTDERMGIFAGSTDIIMAGPPCQGHSSLNNHSRHDDPKNLLYLTVPAAAVALSARHVIIENVPNVVADKHGVVQTSLALLRDSGYHVTHGVLSADRLGWPQTRKRFFLVASRDSVPIGLSEIAASLAHPETPVNWLLTDLAAKELDDGDVMNSVPRLSSENQMRVEWLHDHDAYDLPNEHRPDCHKEGTTYSASYGRISAGQPAPTITGGFLTPGRGRFVHPTQRRVLTPREAARIQGFPDWFDFLPAPQAPPSRAEISRWIGNAVPSILGFAAALSALGGEVLSGAGRGEGHTV